MKFLSTFFFAFGLALMNFAPAAVADIDAPAQYVSDLKDKMLEMFKRNPPQNERRAELCQLAQDNTALVKMADFALNRNKKKFNDDQLSHYYAGFHAMMAKALDSAFKRLDSGTVSIDQNSRPVDGGHIVNLTVQVEKREPIRVQFFVMQDAEPSTQMRLFDASLNGMRLMMLKQNEFNELISQGEHENLGSGPDALIAELKTNPACP
ncbi:MAG: ABC transporter substrate-binding protein [Bdellovibrionales bacterium]